MQFNNIQFCENPFRFNAADSILHEKDLGIAGDMMTVLTPENAACMIRGLQRCPWSASNFSLEFRIDGERIVGRDWVWLPNIIKRHGCTGGWEAKTLTMLPPETDICLMRLELTNHTGKSVAAPLQVIIRGSARYEDRWEFGVPAVGDLYFSAAKAENFADKSKLTLTGSSALHNSGKISDNDAQITVVCSLPDMGWFSFGDIWECTRTVEPGESVCVDLAVNLGGSGSEVGETDFELLERKSFEWLVSETGRILSLLPVFETDDPALNAMYYRSVVTYCLNRWINPDYTVSPFYSTGSITGGCMCSYLWDYSGGMMLHPLVDPETNKKMIRAYLHIDLTSSYAVTPLDGSPTGPWYHINQEKIIGMIFFHVMNTGDTHFLDEMTDGRSILEWAIFHACVGDDLTKPVALIDYGDAGKSHLELRREYIYKGVMPDLNARRYINYQRAYILSRLAGRPAEYLTERAEGLKALMKTLWDEKVGWYDFIWEGKREKRYTVQMFKFFASNVIDDHIRDRLAAHLNEREFLSKFGLHSMSKLDPAYDQIDIDNGGGGICLQFTMQIAWQLYEAGYDKEASDLLNRVKWVGLRLPYIGDSVAANMLFDREDTPLQADISSTSIAQTLLFGVCGIRVGYDLNIRICPPKDRPSKHISVKNIHLCGRLFSVIITGDDFRVLNGDEVFSGKVGEDTVTLKAVCCSKIR